MIAALVLAAAITSGHPADMVTGGARPSSYTVVADDSFWSIAARELGNGDRWPRLYAVNRGTVGDDPNLIYPGERLILGSSPRSGIGAGWPAGRVVPARGRAPAPSTRHRGYGAGAVTSGTLGCAGLEVLWASAGGNPAVARLAAAIAMAESGGSQYATGAAGERGYWQINPDHGSLSTYDPWGNARAAVIISADGTDFSPWSTYTSGVYAGRC